MISSVSENSHSIRWRPGQKQQLERIARHCGVEVVDVVRNAADALIKYAEAHNGVVPFPLDFEIGFTPRRLVLHEPAGNVRPALVRPGDEVKTRTPARKAGARD